MKNCILCGSALSSKPLLTIENMPSGAQNIPTAEQLLNDKGVKTELLFCNECGLVQLGSEAVPYYRDVIRAGGYNKTMYELRKKQYSEWIDFCSLNGKKIIEVGCGQGEFLQTLTEFPVKAYGTEHKPELVTAARSKELNVEKIFPDSEDTVFESAPFDGFMSFNFLEHQPNPKTYLRAIRNNLTDDGCGLITVPSFEYISNENSYYEIIPDHIAYYTMETLTLLCESCGFDVIKKEVVNRDTLSIIVKCKKAPVVNGLVAQRTSIEKEFTALINKASADKKSVAIWGASHQGFTLCATLSLGDKVSYIIDSAPFKQGRFSPVSHIPIISPDEAILNPADIIIIAAPGYSAEISGIIRKDYKNDVRLFTLLTDHLEEI